MNIQKLNEIFDLRRKEMKDNKFSFNFYYNINTCFNKLISFLEINNLIYNENSKKLFLIKMEKEIRKKDYNYYIYATEIIDGIDKLSVTNRIERIIRNEKNIDINNNNAILEQFIENRKEFNKNKTFIEKRNILINIMMYGEKNNINNFSKLNLNNILFLRNYCLSFELYSKKKRYCWTLRDFLNFLFEEHYLDRNYSYTIDKMQLNTKSLITTWNNDEVEKIVSSLSENNNTEMRNKAMALLTIRLGIRFCDVKNLKFENIDWKNNIIKFIQRKTNVSLELPLPEEVGCAIIKYIKTSRPKTKSKYIFVSHDELVDKLSDSFNIRDYLIDTYKKADVDYLSKTKKGIHTFRHALATNMLKCGTPSDIISKTLGHLNRNSAKTYINFDDNMLREFCLDLGVFKNE